VGIVKLALHWEPALQMVVMSVTIYTCSVSFYALAASVRYNWKDDTFAKYLKKPIHLFVITLPLVLMVAGVYFEAFNIWKRFQFCNFTDYPDVECE
jgi:hypothetical protein